MAVYSKTYLILNSPRVETKDLTPVSFEISCPKTRWDCLNRRVFKCCIQAFEAKVSRLELFKRVLHCPGFIVWCRKNYN